MTDEIYLGTLIDASYDVKLLSMAMLVNPFTGGPLVYTIVRDEDTAEAKSLGPGDPVFYAVDHGLAYYLPRKEEPR